jgi:hypothetical protein
MDYETTRQSLRMKVGYQRRVTPWFMNSIGLGRALLRGCGGAVLLLVVGFASLTRLHAAEERFPNTAAQSSLPQGAGLAARFKADAGIGSDAAVLSLPASISDRPSRSEIPAGNGLSPA